MRRVCLDERASMRRLMAMTVAALRKTAGHSSLSGDDPADAHPILRWSRVDGAVMYDVQILKKEEEKDADGKPSTSYEPFMDDQKPIRQDWNWICPILSWDRSFTGASAASI